MLIFTSEMDKVIPIRAGVGNCYLIIHATGYYLVDTGSPGYGEKIIKSITSRGLNIKELQFIFLTHTHYDHAGNARFLKEVSGAPLIVHNSEAGFLKNGWHEVPYGTNPVFKMISMLGRKFSPSHARFEAAEPDILFNNQFSTIELGAPATIVHTPGHTLGSSTLIFGKQAFVGDSMVNMAGRIWPPFANNETELLKSWKLLAAMDVDFFYPAHGKRLKKTLFLEALSKKTG